MLRLRSIILLLVLLALLTSACGQKSTLNKLELAPVSALPTDKQAAPTSVQEAYRFVLANPDIMSKIPCYCGCGEGHAGETPHTSVKDCFVREIKSDGTVVWDEMGMG
jgi:hypothetical protein